MIIGLYKFPKLYILELKMKYYKELLKLTDPHNSISIEYFILDSNTGKKIDDLILNHAKVLYEENCEDVLVAIVAEQ